jgi:hypothetical protein
MNGEKQQHLEQRTFQIGPATSVNMVRHFYGLANGLSFMGVQGRFYSHLHSTAFG